MHNPSERKEREGREEEDEEEAKAWEEKRRRDVYQLVQTRRRLSAPRWSSRAWMGREEDEREGRKSGGVPTFESLSVPFPKSQITRQLSSYQSWDRFVDSGYRFDETARLVRGMDSRSRLIRTEARADLPPLSLPFLPSFLLLS